MTDSNNSGGFIDRLWRALFEVADTVFPEFSFTSKDTGGGRIWKSRVSLRADGYTGKDAGQAFISERTPFYISDLNPVHGRAIWQYIAQRENLDSRGVFRYLCDATGQHPEKSFSPDQLRRIEERQRAAELFETAGAYFLDQLHTTTTEAAQAARDYLKQRGYTLAELRQPGQELKDGYTGGERLELGFFPSDLGLRLHLESIKTPAGQGRFSPDEIAGLIDSIPHGAGGRVSLTLRERGRIVGFKFRSVDGKEPKYLSQSGYPKANHLTGLTRPQNGQIVLVEGDLDAMRAHAAGLLNVAAIGGTDISEKQIEKAIRAGAHTLVLMLDNDAAGLAATRRAIETLYRYQEKTGQTFAVLVASFPTGVKDLDELLSKPDGRELAAAAIGRPHLAGTWLSNWFEQVKGPELVNQYAGGDYTNPVLRVYIQREIAELFRILPTTDARHFEETAAGEIAAAYYIDLDAIKAEAQTIREREAARQYEQAAADLATKAAAAFGAGDAKEGETLLGKVKEARGKVGEAKAAEILENHTQAAYVGRLRNKGERLKTGYFVKRPGMAEPEEIEIPGGGISVFAASTGHGKTTLLINLLLEVCERNPGKEFHYFTLEESAEVQAAKALNCFADLHLSAKNHASIEAWLTDGTDEFIKAGARLDFFQKEEQFWKLIGSRIFFHYLENQTVEALNDAIRYLHKRRKVGGVFVDYFQLLNLENPARLVNRHDQLKAICLQIKDTAIGTGLPLIFAAQFNQEVQSEEDLNIRRIGEAGDISRIAALVAGIWDRHQTPEVWADEAGKRVCKSKPAPEMFVKILKQRGGAVGGNMAFQFEANRAKVRTNEPTRPAAQSAAAPQKPAENHIFDF